MIVSCPDLRHAAYGIQGETIMAFKTIMTGVAAVALAVTPTLATAQNAVPATVTQPAVEEVEGSELRGRFGGNAFTIILLIAGAILLALTAEKFLEDDQRVSP